MKLDDEAEREGLALQRKFKMPRISESKKSRGVIRKPTKQETAELFKPVISPQLNDDLSFDLQRYLHVIGRPIREFRNPHSCNIREA